MDNTQVNISGGGGEEKVMKALNKWNRENTRESRHEISEIKIAHSTKQIWRRRKRNGRKRTQII
jgi:hypothetical protein